MHDPSSVLAEIQHLEAQLAELRSRVEGTVERERLPDGLLPILAFRVGAERAALLQTFVSEVVLMCRLTPLPEAPPWVPGLLNCRGQVIPVVDTLARLARTARRPELSDLIVVCDVQDRRVGFVVQEILGVETVPSGSLQAPSAGIAHAPYLCGLLQSGGQTTLLLSAAALLATSAVPSPG